MSPIGNLNHFFEFLSISPLGLNWVDILIIIVVLIYLIEGWGLGFIRAFADFISFIGSFILGLTFYSFFANLLVKHLAIPQGFANAGGFFIAAFISEILLAVVFRRLLILFYSSTNFERRPKIFKMLNKIFGVIPSFLSAVVLLSFILTMIITLPLSPFLKTSVSQSQFGNSLTANTLGVEKVLNAVFGGAVSDALTFLTIEPKSKESINLNFKTSNFSIDSKAEGEMLSLVNSERTSRGLKAVVGSEPLTSVARNHCMDMFKRGYFSHYTLEGLSPFDRMAQFNISFTFAGENLALAPNVTLAMQGLMNSPGHRANILSEDFEKLGVGIINGGIYGEMFCQEFTD